jgi:hypothetical protein
MFLTDHCLQKVRVAVYVQIALAILFCFLYAHPLITSVLRNHLVTLYAILIALQLAHRAADYRYSIQDIVVVTITWSLVVSSFCSLSVSFHSTRVPIVVFDLLATCGGFVWTISLMVRTRSGTHCLEVAYSSSPIVARLPLISWVLSSITILTAMVYVRAPRKPFRYVLFANWALAWVATMVITEISMSIYLFKNVQSVELLSGTSWGFGQVMAMVALASQMFGIANYYTSKLGATEGGFTHRVVIWVELINGRFVEVFRGRVSVTDARNI